MKDKIAVALILLAVALLVAIALVASITDANIDVTCQLKGFDSGGRSNFWQDEYYCLRVEKVWFTPEPGGR